MEVRHFAAALSALKVLAEQNCGTIRTEPLDVVGWVEDSLVFAAPTDGDERHLGIDELAKRAAQISIVVAWHSHVIALAGPLRPRLGFEKLPVGEAEDEHVGVVAAERMRTRTQRESFAEEANGHVVSAGAARCR